MTGKNSEKVEIFGQEYKIKGVGDPEYFHRIAGYVDKKMREIAHSSGIMSQSRIAILAALNITDELFQERENSKKSRIELEKQAVELSDLIDSRLGAAK